VVLPRDVGDRVEGAHAVERGGGEVDVPQVGPDQLRAGDALAGAGELLGRTTAANFSTNRSRGSPSTVLPRSAKRSAILS